VRKRALRQPGLQEWWCVLAVSSCEVKEPCSCAKPQAIPGPDSGAVPWLISALFAVCMACLIASLMLFIHDINQSLAALKLELEVEGLADV
jgi:hypothetical protein